MGASVSRTILCAFFLLLSHAVYGAGWQWMMPQRLSALMKEGSGLWIVDVRSEATFAESHIEGAVHIPAAFLATKRLPKGRIIVLADDSLGLRKAREGAAALQKKGHDRVFLLEGGMPAWEAERYPVPGKLNRPAFRGVMPDDIDWARESRIPLRIFDLRDKDEQERGGVPQAESVAGKNLPERLERVKEMLAGMKKKGHAGRVEETATAILVFPATVDPRPVSERTFRDIPGDVRFLEGGYAAWAAKPDKSASTAGTCPICPKGTGGKK